MRLTVFPHRNRCWLHTHLSSGTDCDAAVDMLTSWLYERCELAGTLIWNYPSVKLNILLMKTFLRTFPCQNNVLAEVKILIIYCGLHLQLNSRSYHKRLLLYHYINVTKRTERNKWYILTHLGESGYCLQTSTNYQVNRPNCCKFSGQWPRSLWNPRRWKSQFTPQPATQFTALYHWEVSVRISTRTLRFHGNLSYF